MLLSSMPKFRSGSNLEGAKSTATVMLDIKLSKKESHLRLNITEKLCDIPALPRPLHTPERDSDSEKCESVFFFLKNKM